MGFLKTALIGAAIYAGVKYITKKDVVTGKSIMDDLMEKAPEWMENAKGYKDEISSRVSAVSEDLTR
nr:YtxH domain-containing protein [Pedobacter sp. ASV2]